MKLVDDMYMIKRFESSKYLKGDGNQLFPSTLERENNVLNISHPQAFLQEDLYQQISAQGFEGVNWKEIPDRKSVV